MDSHLVILVKDGNYNAFLEVYESLHKKVFHFFRKKLNQPEVAEELTQDAFVKLWRYRNSLSEDIALEKQMFTICYGLLINYAKKAAVHKAHSIAYIKTQNCTAQQVSAPDSSFETNDELMQVIDTLSPASKKVASLKIIHGFNNNEIAKQLSLSPKTVEGHVTHVFKVLKKTLNILLLITFFK